MTAITTVEFAYFDDAPFVDRNRFVDGRTETTPEIVDEYAGLPAPFLDALTEVGKRQDDARCARCADPVGFVLHENNMGFEALKWTPIGLAREVGQPEHVVVLCELCTPLVSAPETTPDGAQ